MSDARRFPPPWSVEEQKACFVVRDQNGQQLAYVYFEGRGPLGEKHPGCVWNFFHPRVTGVTAPLIRRSYFARLGRFDGGH